MGEETILCSNGLMSVLGQGTTLALFCSEIVVFLSSYLLERSLGPFLL